MKCEFRDWIFITSYHQTFFSKKERQGKGERLTAADFMTLRGHGEIVDDWFMIDWLIERVELNSLIELIELTWAELNWIPLMNRQRSPHPIDRSMRWNGYGMGDGEMKYNNSMNDWFTYPLTYLLTYSLTHLTFTYPRVHDLSQGPVDCVLPCGPWDKSWTHQNISQGPCDLVFPARWGPWDIWCNARKIKWLWWMMVGGGDGWFMMMVCGGMVKEFWIGPCHK